MEEEEFQEMVERTASQLKRNEISILAKKLGLSEFDIHDISLKYGGNFWRQKLEIFYRWRSTYREYATRERLSRVMNEIKGSKCRNLDSTNEKASTKKKKKTDQRSTSAKVPLRRERTFRSVHLRGSAIQMSPRWRHEKRHHPISTMLKPDDLSPRTSPPNISEDFRSGYHVTREIDQSSEDEVPSSSCVYRGGKLRIQIHLRAGGFTAFERKEENDGREDAREIIEESLGNDVSSVLPAINHHPVQTGEINSARNLREKHNLGERRLIFDKEDDLFISEEFKNMKLDSELGPCDAQNPYVQCTVDSLEAFDGVYVDDVKIKCILLTCRVAGIDSLDTLWRECRDGTLRGKIFQAFSSFIRGWASGPASWEDVRVSISQAEYVHCRKQLTEKRLLRDSGCGEKLKQRSLKPEKGAKKNNPRMEPALNQLLRPLKSDLVRAACNVKPDWRADEVIAGWEPMSFNACC